MSSATRSNVAPAAASAGRSFKRVQPAAKHVAAPKGLKLASLRPRRAAERRQATWAGSKLTVTAEVETSKFVPVLKPEELPKGTRTIITTANNKSIMLLWYRNEVFAVESRSPAEGAYSTGFMDSRLTQDYGIECPATGTTFSLKTGEIQEWYPNNPVLRRLTPKDTCRPMEVFPVKVDDTAISVDPVNSNLSSTDGYVWESASTTGGSASSLENNNVFGIEPQMYLTTGEKLDDSSGAVGKVDPATLAITTVAVAIIAVVGTATCLYYENLIALGLLWAGGFGIVAYSIVTLQKDDE